MWESIPSSAVCQVAGVYSGRPRFTELLLLLLLCVVLCCVVLCRVVLCCVVLGCVGLWCVGSFCVVFVVVLWLCGCCVGVVLVLC